MAFKRVTMQDIADACGLSRNTVSKVFNGRGSVPEATRQLVLARARDLGYSQSPAEPEAREKGSIALLAQHKLLSHSFGAFFITSFTDRISRAGFTMKYFEISAPEIAQRRLPSRLELEDTAGILTIELFDRGYLDMLCTLGKPTVVVDGFARAGETLMDCDYISMENRASEAALVRRMLRAGARRVGFVGDVEHCNSFYERWQGCCLALSEAGLSFDRSCSILAEDSELYGDPAWLGLQLDAMPALPDGFACANDYLAIHLMTALKKRGLRIPGDVMVAGFDGTLEASLVEPALSTAQIPGKEIGAMAAALLCARIRTPDQPLRRVYVQSAPVPGASIR